MGTSRLPGAANPSRALEPVPAFQEPPSQRCLREPLVRCRPFVDLEASWRRRPFKRLGAGTCSLRTSGTAPALRNPRFQRWFPRQNSLPLLLAKAVLPPAPTSKLSGCATSFLKTLLLPGGVIGKGNLGSQAAVSTAPPAQGLRLPHLVPPALQGRLLPVSLAKLHAVALNEGCSTSGPPEARAALPLQEDTSGASAWAPGTRAAHPPGVRGREPICLRGGAQH